MNETNSINNNHKIRKQLDDYTCSIIIGRCLAEQKVVQVSREMDIPRPTVTDCVKHYNKTGTGVILERRRRFLKLSERDQRAIKRSLSENPFDSFVAHNARLMVAGIHVHNQTPSIYR